MIFNSGNGAIADKMGMDWSWSSFEDKNGKKVTYKKAGDAALEVIEQYHRRIPGVKELATRAKDIAEAHGYVQTKHGRRLRFPHKYKTYKASGLAIQATAADINKEMWLLCHRLERETGAHLIMNTHDSYEINVPMELNPRAIKDILQDEIRTAVPWFRVPLVIDMNGVGANYWASQGK
jgi:DNA polymerase I-like protein with 3'-5' exonuclease and polymerase domains